MKIILFTLKLISFVILTLFSLSAYSTTSNISVCANNTSLDISPQNISTSSLILQGTLIPDTDAIVDGIQNENYKNTKINLIKTNTIKGASNLPDIIEIEYSTRPINLRPCSELILELDLSEVTVFLKPVLVDGTYKYFFEASNNSVVRSSTSQSNEIVNITNSQLEFNNNFEKDYIIKDEALHQEISTLIQEIKSEKTQQVAIKKLISLGHKAVPSIIHRMDNYSKINHNEIRINLSNGAIKTYSPDLIVDALAIILNSITGKHYGYIYNGATDIERAQAITAWRTYLMN